MRLTVNGTELTQEFEIAKDPRVAATQADLQEKFDLHARIRDRLSEVNTAIIELRSVRQQTAEWASRSAAVGSSSDAIARVSGRLIADLDSAERRLMKVGFRGALDRPNIPPTINTRLAELCEVVAVADFAPPRQAYDVFEVLSRRAGEELASLRVTIDTGVAELDRLIRENGVPMIGTGNEWRGGVGGRGRGARFTAHPFCANISEGVEARTILSPLTLPAGVRRALARATNA